MKGRCAPAGGPGFIRLALLFVVLLGLGAVGCDKGTEAARSPAPGPSIDRAAADPLGALASAEGKVVVADFGRNTCPSCVTMGKILGRIEPRVAGTAVILKVNVDREPILIRKYGIRLIPTILVFDPAGKNILRREGVLEEADLLRVIGQAGSTWSN